MAWGERMVLVGAALDSRLLHGVVDLAGSAEQGDKESKDILNRKAQAAKTKAGASVKADKGTELHGLSELVDQGIPLPAGITFDDMIDMDAYKQATKGFYIVHMEKLVVHDAICVAGTPDRVSEWKGDHPLVAPDGYVFEPGSGERLITDLKTGTTDYGQLKMAMQLSIYSRSLLYDYTTGERSPLENINQKWGIIMNIPAGSGEATLYWADLEMGWEAVEIAGKIRALRSSGRKALTELPVA